MTGNTWSPVFIAGCIFALSAVILYVRTPKQLTPFHLIAPFFSVECFLVRWPQMAQDSYGRTKYWEINDSVGAALIVIGLVTAGVAISISPTSVAPEERFFRRAELVVPPNYIFFGSFCTSVLSSGIAVAKLGSFPLFVLSASAAEEQLGYAQVYQGFITYLAWGTTRLMAVVLSVMLVEYADDLSTFFRRHWLLFAFFSGGLLLNLLDGQRTLLIYPILVVVYALAVRRFLKARWIVGVALFLIVSFIMIGNFRTTHVTEGKLSNPTGNTVIDYTTGWFVAYLEPNIFNLNNLCSVPPAPSYGALLVTQIVPDRLAEVFIDIPRSAPEYMHDMKLFAQPGLTYRTIVGDFVPDFGLWGAVIITSATLVAGRIMLARAKISVQALYLYLALSIGLSGAPFMNLFVGIAGIVPLLGVFLVRAHSPLPGALRPRTGGVRPEDADTLNGP